MPFQELIGELHQFVCLGMFHLATNNVTPEKSLNTFSTLFVSIREHWLT